MRDRGTIGRAALGIAISAVALFLVAKSVNLAQAWSAIQQAQTAWLALLVGFIVIDLATRAVRMAFHAAVMSTLRATRNSATAEMAMPSAARPRFPR